MKKILLLYFFITFTILFGAQKPTIELTEQENLWIKNNPVIKLAVMSYWPKNKNGSNIHYGLIELLNKYANINIIPVTFNSWESGYKQVLNGKNINGIMGLSWSKEREKDFLYTPAYDFTPCYLITRENDSTIKSFDDLKDKTIYLKEKSITHNIIRETSSTTKYIDVQTIEQMYNKLSTLNEADAILSYFINLDQLEKNDLKIVDTIYDKYGEVSVGINKEYPELFSILNKTFKIIPKDELSTLRNKDVLKLTQEEKDWLQNKTIINYVYNSNWKPLEWANELQEHSGIISDLIKLIEEKSSIKFNAIYTENFDKALKKIENNEAVMISSIISDKQANLDFTSKNIYSIPYVFINKKDSNYEDGFSAVKNKKIGILKNNDIYQFLTQNKISNNLKFFQSTKLAFEELEKDNLDLLIVNATTAKYYINIMGFEEFKISYKTIFNLDLKIAVSKEMPKQLISILDKSINNISKKELSDIVYKWTEKKIESPTDWILIGKISGGILVVLIIVFINNQKLKSLVEAKTKDIQKQKKELENILSSFNKNVIFSKTDLKGNITHVSEAFCKISGYSKNELIGKPHNIVRHPDMSKKIFKEIWDALKNEYHITKEIKNLRKDGTYYWVETKFEPDYDSDGKLIGYSALRQDITSKKEVEELSANLEIKIAQRTKDLELTKQEVEKILASILLPVLITSKKTRKIIYANKYAETQYDTTLDEMIGASIDDLYSVQGQQEHIINELTTKGFVENLEENFKTHSGKEFTALLSVIPITYKEEPAYIGMTTDITKQKNIEDEIRQIHKHTRDSIEYASLIQRALIPEKDIFNHYFDDYFALWNPKDIVGGDIYLFEELNSDECLILVIDCTGHGVPGAFVTMLVKAIERQVSAIIHNNSFIEVSPSWILSYFNKTIKTLLKQETIDSISNAGFDGGIVYYNKKDKIIKFSGAETPLFYFDENGEFKTIKGSRHSVGYKKSDADYEFKEHIIEVKDGMKFYLTTDGYLDQNGGDKDFPFGKKRFGQLLEENHDKKFNEQENILLQELKEYQGNTDRNDDVTVIGFKI